MQKINRMILSSIQSLGTASLHLLQVRHKVFVQHTINCILAIIFALAPLSIDENNESLQTQSVSMLHFVCSVRVLDLVNKFLIGVIALFILRHACRIDTSHVTIRTKTVFFFFQSFSSSLSIASCSSSKLVTTRSCMALPLTWAGIVTKKMTVLVCHCETSNMAGIVSKSEVASIVGGKGHHHRCQKSVLGSGRLFVIILFAKFRGECFCHAFVTLTCSA